MKWTTNGTIYAAKGAATPSKVNKRTTKDVKITYQNLETQEIRVGIPYPGT